MSHHFIWSRPTRGLKRNWMFGSSLISWAQRWGTAPVGPWLLEYAVGAAHRFGWDIDPQRPGGLEIQCEVDVIVDLDRDVGWRDPPQDLVYQASRLATGRVKIGAVASERTLVDVPRVREHRRQSETRGCLEHVPGDVQAHGPWPEEAVHVTASQRTKRGLRLLARANRPLHEDEAEPTSSLSISLQF